MAGSDDERFRFAQFELPWALGLDDGRYVVREPGGGEAMRQILVLATLGAPERRLLKRSGRPRAAASDPPPEPVTTTRATVIEATPISAGEAESWLSGMDAVACADWLASALRILNRAVRALRLASADPGVHDVGREHALVTRIGHGRGRQVADGRWSAALEVPFDARKRARRADALRAHERLAGLLGGQEQLLACEELTLRARADLEAGRHREAALQLRVALEAAMAELGSGRERLAVAERVDELRDDRGAVGAAANEALLGELGEATLAGVADALGRLEAVLRTRAVAGPQSAPGSKGST